MQKGDHPLYSQLKRVLLLQIFGYKGTLIHVVAVYLLLLGLLTALIGVTMDITIEKLLDLKQYLCDLVDNGLYRVAVWILYTLVGVTAAFLWTKVVSPTANGSGVSELKVTLLGNHIPNFLSLRTFIAKVLGLVLTIGCGMWVGFVRE